MEAVYTSSLTTITEVPSPLSEKPFGKIPQLPVFEPGEFDESDDSTTTSLPSSVSSSYVTEIERYHPIRSPEINNAGITSKEEINEIERKNKKYLDNLFKNKTEDLKNTQNQESKPITENTIYRSTDYLDSTDFSTTTTSSLSDLTKPHNTSVNSVLSAILEKDVAVRHYKNGGKFVGEVDEVTKHRHGKGVYTWPKLKGLGIIPMLKGAKYSKTELEMY